MSITLPTTENQPDAASTASKRGMIRTVLFDLDGTLLDTAADFVAVLEQMCQESGRPALPLEAIHQTVSSGARALVELAFGQPQGSEDFTALHQRLLELYALQIDRSRARLYPGMAGLLTALEEAGLGWGIVTNKPEKFTSVLLDRLALSERCGVVICPDHVTKTKPDPEALLLACQRLGCGPGACLYIGDHPRDIEAGTRAGMQTMAAAYGYLPKHPPLEQWRADVIVESADQIAGWLKDNRHL